MLSLIIQFVSWIQQYVHNYSTISSSSFDGIIVVLCQVSHTNKMMMMKTFFFRCLEVLAFSSANERSYLSIFSILVNLRHIQVVIHWCLLLGLMDRFVCVPFWNKKGMNFTFFYLVFVVVVLSCRINNLHFITSVQVFSLIFFEKIVDFLTLLQVAFFRRFFLSIGEKKMRKTKLFRTSFLKTKN